MTIGSPVIEMANGLATYSVAVHIQHKQRTLWFQVDACYAGMISTKADAALCALFVPAMFYREPIYVEGPVSALLFHNISTQIQPLIIQEIPTLSMVDIFPAVLDHNREKAAGVCAGFSGGVDSFSLVSDYYLADVPESLRLTHLLYNNVGAHGWGNEVAFREQYQKLSRTAADLNLPFIAVNSNVASFYGGAMGNFDKTHHFRNAAVPLFLQKGMGRFYYAAAFRLDITHPKHVFESSIQIVPLLSSENLDSTCVGWNYSRNDKIKQLSLVPQTYNNLDVCVEPDGSGKNCSKCRKCLWTLLSMEIAGVIERYAPSFHLPVYYRYRDAYIRYTRKHGSVYHRANFDFAASMNYDLTVPEPDAKVVEMKNNSLPKHCTLTQIEQMIEGVTGYSWVHELYKANLTIQAYLPAGEALILADEGQFISRFPFSATIWPFPEKEGTYWGCPENDEAAITELTRQVGEGRQYIAFLWPTFWWLDYYGELKQYLEGNYTLIAGDERVQLYHLQDAGNTQV